jgi:hypothetical protein
MKSPLAALALGASLLAIPGAILAEAPAMAPMKPPAMGATMVCRPAATGEKATAMMGAKGIVCKSMAPMMKGGMMMVPDTKSAADKVWSNWLQQAVTVPRAGDA